MVRQFAWGMWAALGLVACGGRTLDDALVPDSGGEIAVANSGAPDNSGSSDGLPPSTVSLADCHLGFVQAEHPSDTCNFVYQGRCYDKKALACDCACPHKSGVICASSFAVPNGKVDVFCK